MHSKPILILIVLIYFLQSCTLEDNSIFENGKNSVLAKELLQSSIKQVAYNQSAIGGRSAGAIMQYYQEQDASITFYNRYYLFMEFLENMWSQGFYSGSLSSLDEMLNIATRENEDDVKAITLILLAHEYGALSNMFGDIPFSEALQGETVVKPKYDTQKDVYEGINFMLDEAIEIIGDNTMNDNLIEYDLIYQGNLQNWKKFASGLKARFLLNQRNQNQNLNNEILSLLNASFANHAEQAMYTYNSEFINPQYTFAVERPGTLATGDYFINQLLSTEDPRRSSLTFMRENIWEYFLSKMFYPVEFISKNYEATAEIPMLSFTEILFMRAELSFHMGTNRDETSNLLKEAITSSMLDNDLDLVDSTSSFITANGEFNGLSDEEVLERIIDQAYVAYYGFNHLQSWTNYRRTGYPNIKSTTQEPSDINPSNIVPRRFLYPTSELEYNLENFQEATLRQDGALLDSDMWIFN